ncbi:YDG/SRA domain-containing protein [Streptomyces sp. DT2A-34]|uniref:YDG/SRA domain-containing protein n=1 Tax=Streptomyces sp. DT2A-34 TaxID=3051182 RepID=UPI00265C7F66|nr:YDG/SRA domain-containing protein [Streptomyces sp. DT2A-34]MDO0914662.1 YDG/SRA domain-containing protein [Streptomyces sp. DT2A-34]
MTEVINRIQYAAMGERRIGHIEGIAPGAEYHRRIPLQRAKLHGDNQRGISWLADPDDGSDVADAIVLHGGYEDDEDHWTWVRYTGASRDADKYKANGVTKLLASQSWSYQDNAALKRSYERGHPIRIIRGWKGDPRYSPIDCYRYDGLYEITEIRTAISKSPAPDGTPIEICQFDLKRLPDKLQDPTSVERQISDLLERQEELQPEELEPLEDELEEGAEEELLREEKFPETRSARVQRLVRDAAVIRNVKALYDGECQVCSLRLLGPDEKPYSEGAHIRPLGKPHRGPDVEPNVLCLCPNCHVRLDIGAIVIEDDWSIVVRAGALGGNVRPKLKRHRKHKIHLDYIRYHRQRWQGKA